MRHEVHAQVDAELARADPHRVEGVQVRALRDVLREGAHDEEARGEEAQRGQEEEQKGER